MTVLVANLSDSEKGLEFYSDKMLWAGNAIVSHNCPKWMITSPQGGPSVLSRRYAKYSDVLLYVGGAGSHAVIEIMMDYFCGKLSYQNTVKALTPLAMSNDDDLDTDMLIISNCPDVYIDSHNEGNGVEGFCLSVSDWTKVNFAPDYLGYRIQLPVAMGCGENIIRALLLYGVEPKDAIITASKVESGLPSTEEGIWYDHVLLSNKVEIKNNKR